MLAAFEWVILNSCAFKILSGGLCLKVFALDSVWSKICRVFRFSNLNFFSMKRALFLNGSFRQGNTSTLISWAKEALGPDFEATEVNVAKLKNAVNGCANCGGCKETGSCALGDDSAKLIDSLQYFDVIAFCSPIYMAGITAALKAVIDRFHAIIEEDAEGNLTCKLKDKKFVAILHGGGDENDSGLDSVVLQLKHFASFMEAAEFPTFFQGGLGFDTSKLRGNKQAKLSLIEFVEKNFK